MVPRHPRRQPLRAVRLWAAIILLAGNLAQAQTADLIAEISHPLLEEVSGIARSSHAGVFWVHNDSGNAPHLFPINLEGGAVR